MAKRIVLCVFALFTANFLCAGDAAGFVDIGFSADGKTYVFAQYGKTDRTFYGYAEIYAVDVAKNEFLANGVFTTNGSSKNGFAVFEDLRASNWSFLSRYNCTPVSIDQILYLHSGEDKTPDAEIRFQDYENITDSGQLKYTVRMVPFYEGTGKNVRSSFYITVDTVDKYGYHKQIVVGTPAVKRQGVSGYSISKIFTDKSGKSLVFLIEKTIIDDTGISIRYMVETIRL